MTIKFMQDQLFVEDNVTRYESYYQGPRLGLRDYQGYETRLRITFEFNNTEFLANHIDLMVLGPGAKWERLGEVYPRADIKDLNRTTLWNDFYGKLIQQLQTTNERLRARNESSAAGLELLAIPTFEEVQKVEYDQFMYNSTEIVSKALSNDINRLLKIAKIIE